MKMFRSNGWSIGRHELQLGDIIGHGEFGDVLLGTYQTKNVAVKVLKQTSGVVETLLDEAMLMQKLNHANLGE